jgi:hypothetical protein
MAEADRIAQRPLLNEIVFHLYSILYGFRADFRPLLLAFNTGVSTVARISAALKSNAHAIFASVSTLGRRIPRSTYPMKETESPVRVASSFMDTPLTVRRSLSSAASVSANLSAKL